jgi:hypothetical protein
MSVGARAGLIGPPLFAAVFFVEGWLRPGYDAFGQFVSELSLGPRGFIQIANFMVFGVLFTTFAIALRSAFRARRISAAGPTLLVVIGVAIFVSGPFVMDPTSTPRAMYTPHGLVHAIAGAVVFLGWPIALGLIAAAIRRDDRWRPLLVPTVIAAFATLAVLVLMTATKRAPGQTPWAYSGLAQRTHICTFLAWTVLTARRLGPIEAER